MAKTTNQRSGRNLSQVVQVFTQDAFTIFILFFDLGQKAIQLLLKLVRKKRNKWDNRQKKKASKELLAIKCEKMAAYKRHKTVIP